MSSTKVMKLILMLMSEKLASDKRAIRLEVKSVMVCFSISIRTPLEELGFNSASCWCTEIRTLIIARSIKLARSAIAAGLDGMAISKPGSMSEQT